MSNLERRVKERGDKASRTEKSFHEITNDTMDLLFLIIALFVRRRRMIFIVQAITTSNTK